MINPRYLLPIIFSMLFVVACSGKNPQSSSHGNGFALVELYTSEGCSSCPSAEAVLTKVHEEYKEHVYVMEFHVDYWNYIGWKDVFSSADYTKRQQHYASLLHLNSTYTPQAIVNGIHELVGSNDIKLHNIINEELQKMPSIAIQITAKASDRNINVHYAAGSIKRQVLNIALVQKHAATNVKRGENSGRNLQHINIVRALKTIDKPGMDGTATIELPAGVAAKDCIIIAYTQQIDTWKVSCAMECAIN